MTTRTLATTQIINGIYPIEGADRICQYGINGWKVIDQVGRYQVGDLVVYIEIDSWIPHTVAPFLSKGKEPRSYNGIPGEKLRTVRLKKALSQGLMLPIDFIDLYNTTLEEVGRDVSGILNITKWEPPPEFRHADAKGTFPDFIKKTDQERIQNCFREIEYDTLYEITEKLEGSSMTVYHNQGEFGVCSRNLDLKENEENTFWKTALATGIREVLTKLGTNLAIQGELVGPKIQGNIYKLDDYKWYVFDIFDIDTQTYLCPGSRSRLLALLNLTSVPIIEERYTLTENLEELLNKATGYSVLNPKQLREGLVYKSTKGTFKVISNKYLEKSE
jgi:RNA ligase (TIGR02306 family)